MRPKLEEGLKKIAEYKIGEWARRLDEVGGSGFGGTELAYSPHFVRSAWKPGRSFKCNLLDSMTRIEGKDFDFQMQGTKRIFNLPEI